MNTVFRSLRGASCGAFLCPPVPTPNRGDRRNSQILFGVLDEILTRVIAVKAPHLLLSQDARRVDRGRTPRRNQRSYARHRQQSSDRRS